MAAPISQTKEIEIVSRIVRGDTQEQIAEELNVTRVTVANVKKRQANAIATISGHLLARKQKIAERILDKTHQLLENRIDNALKYEEKLNEVEEAWTADIADAYDVEDEKLRREMLSVANRKHEAAMRKLKDEFVTTSTLVSISKEMHDESKVDESINPTVPVVDSKAQLVALVEALKEGNEVKLQQIILNPHD